MLRREILQFSTNSVKNTGFLQEKLKSIIFLKSLAFLTDIFQLPNSLNLQLQGRHICIIEMISVIDSFKKNRRY